MMESLSQLPGGKGKEESPSSEGRWFPDDQDGAAAGVAGGIELPPSYQAGV